MKVEVTGSCGDKILVVAVVRDNIFESISCHTTGCAFACGNTKIMCKKLTGVDIVTASGFKIIPDFEINKNRQACFDLYHKALSQILEQLNA